MSHSVTSNVSECLIQSPPSTESYPQSTKLSTGPQFGRPKMSDPSYSMSAMKRGGWADDDYALRQKSKNGVIRTSVLKAMGVGAKTIVDRTSGGPWQRILPGLVLLHNGQPSQQQRNTAASMYGGDGSMLSGRSGLALHGFGTAKTSADVLVLIPPERHRKDVSFVVTERTERMPESTTKMGLPVAPLDRSLLDASRRVRDRRACVALFAEVVQRGAVDVQSLLVELNEGCGRGSAVPRRALLELLGGAHSVAEVDAEKLFERSGLPPSVANVDLYTESGEFIMTTDRWFDDVACACETDSYLHHASPADYEKTIKRRANAEGHGVVVTSHTPKMIAEEPERVAADVLTAYRRAQERPRPNIVAVLKGTRYRAAS